MRKYFIESLVNFNKTKKNIYLILNDLGFNVVEPFKEKYPEKVYNAGVSEQNMMGLAAGIASEKAQVFVYSIANFSTFRCAEQIRNDVDYHQLPVTTVSVGSGLSYGNLGYTHHALQDYALMRSFPNTLIVSPGNNEELKSALQYIIDHPQPYYLRLDKDEVPVKKKNKFLIKPGKIIRIHKGHEKKIILTTGNVQHIGEQINSKNYSIYSLPIWGQKTKEITSNQLSKFKEIITVEDHFEDGGFGSWVSECINKLNKKVTIKHKFISTKVINQVGSKKFLMNNFGPGV